MAGKEPTQAMPGERDSKTARRGDGRTDGIIPRDQRGAGGGGPFGPEDADKDFHGGQSGTAYHGHGQLGEKDVKRQDNPNAPSKDA